MSQSWFDDTSWQTGRTLKLLAISSPSGDATGRYQDQIVAVPVPAALVAGLPLLGGLGLARKMRARKYIV